MWEVLIFYIEEKRKEEDEDKKNERCWWWSMVDEDRRDVQESQGRNSIDTRRAYAGARDESCFP